MLDCTFTKVAFERLTNEDETLTIHFFLIQAVFTRGKTIKLYFHGPSSRNSYCRVDRVLGFLSSRRNWYPPPPHPQASVPPPLWFRGRRDTLAGEVVGGGVPILTRGPEVGIDPCVSVECLTSIKNPTFHRKE